MCFYKLNTSARTESEVDHANRILRLESRCSSLYSVKASYRSLLLYTRFTGRFVVGKQTAQLFCPQTRKTQSARNSLHGGCLKLLNCIWPKSREYTYCIIPCQAFEEAGFEQDFPRSQIKGTLLYQVFQWPPVKPQLLSNPAAWL